MINKKHIAELYKKHKINPNNPNKIDLEKFGSKCTKQHTISINNDNLIINSVEPDSPFHEIPIKNIAGIEKFENHIAIVLRNSILFLSKNTNDIHVHINVEKPSLWERIKYLING